jgi:hypothetical protein
MSKIYHILLKSKIYIFDCGNFDIEDIEDIINKDTFILLFLIEYHNNNNNYPNMDKNDLLSIGITDLLVNEYKEAPQKKDNSNNDEMTTSEKEEKTIDYNKIFSGKDFFCVIIDKEPVVIPAKILKESSPLFFSSSADLSINENFDKEMLSLVIALSTCNSKQIMKTNKYLLSIEQYNELHRVYNFFQFKVEIDKMNFRLNPFYEHLIDLDEDYWYKYYQMHIFTTCCRITKFQIYITTPYSKKQKHGEISVIVKYQLNHKEKLICDIFNYSHINSCNANKTMIGIFNKTSVKDTKVKILIRINIDHDNDNETYLCDFFHVYDNDKNDTHKCFNHWKSGGKDASVLKWKQTFEINFKDRKTSQKFTKRTIDYTNPTNLQYI